MKIIILGGFLGSGKTTLLLSLARRIVSAEGGGGEVKLAIIENEIGDVSVDNRTIEAGGYEVSTLFSGCICCSLVTDLTACINVLAENVKPEWVIIETTGVAFPDRVAKTISQYGRDVEKVSIVVIVDAERWELISKALSQLIEGQLEDADCVLINKCDKCAEPEIGLAEQAVISINKNGAGIFRVSGLEGVPDDIWDSVLSLGRTEFI